MFDIVDVLAVREAVRRLTPLQQWICKLLMSGCNHEEIAEQVGVSRRTATEHVERLRRAFREMGFGEQDADGKALRQAVGRERRSSPREQDEAVSSHRTPK